MSAGRTIDLNADVGEADDTDGVAVERALLGVVTSAHVACGGHAGDEHSMRATVQAALDSGVAVGAHPSYPDRAGFGRHAMDILGSDLTRSLSEQIGALVDVARSCGTRVRSVKAHGALYAEVAQGEEAFASLLDAVHATCEPGTALVLQAGSPAVSLARGAGLVVYEEGFCDRAYSSNGGLVARGEPGSVYDDAALAARQALGLARGDTVTADDGTVLTVHVETLCLHGDSPNAVSMARAVRGALTGAGIRVLSVPLE
jgi:UPF0271 protein